MYRPQHPQRERRAPQPHALAEMDKAHPIPHDGNMHHPIVIGWQQVGQPTRAMATPHFNDRTSTKAVSNRRCGGHGRPHQVGSRCSASRSVYRGLGVAHRVCRRCHLGTSDRRRATTGRQKETDDDESAHTDGNAFRVRSAARIRCTVGIIDQRNSRAGLLFT